MFPRQGWLVVLSDISRHLSGTTQGHAAWCFTRPKEHRPVGSWCHPLYLRQESHRAEPRLSPLSAKPLQLGHTVCQDCPFPPGGLLPGSSSIIIQMGPQWIHTTRSLDLPRVSLNATNICQAVFRVLGMAGIKAKSLPSRGSASSGRRGPTKHTSQVMDAMEKKIKQGGKGVLGEECFHRMQDPGKSLTEKMNFELRPQEGDRVGHLDIQRKSILSWENTPGTKPRWPELGWHAECIVMRQVRSERSEEGGGR